MSLDLTTEQVVRRMCVHVERCDKVMDDEFLGRMGDVPLKVRRRMLAALDRVRNKLLSMGME